MAASVCARSEPAALRLLRLGAAVASVGFAGILVLVAVVGAGFLRPTHRAADWIFALCSAVLLLCCVRSLRNATTMRIYTLAAGLAALVSLGFSDLGRGTEGWTYTTGTQTRLISGAMPAALLLAAVVVAAQLGGWLVRRNACSCD